MVDRTRGLIACLLVGSLALVAAPYGAADEPYVVVSTYEGAIGPAAAWDVAPPGVGCIVVEDTPSPLTPKTCGGIRFGGGENTEVANNVAAGVATIVAELAWEDETPGTTLQIDHFCAEVPRGPGGAVLDPDHPCYHVVGGTSPLQIRIDADDWTGGVYDPVGNWTSRVFAFAGNGVPEAGVGVGATTGQSFTMYISVFYGEAAPEGYTAVP